MHFDEYDIDIEISNIESTMIDYIHYVKKGNRLYLGIRFSSGDSYVYSDIRFSEVLNLIVSKSMGSYFSQHIKTKYPYKKLGAIGEQDPLKEI